MMKRSIIAAALLSLGAALIPTQSAKATLTVSATISEQQLSPTSFKYNLSLTNSAASTSSASSLWFGWFPAYDLLASHPTSFTAPAGWTGQDAADVFGTASAQFTTTTASLAPGHSLSGFSFTTPDGPSAILGATSPFFGVPVEQTYVYSIAPESGDVAVLVPTTVAAPEPASLAMLLGAPIALLKRRKRR
jgi:hypothetical protein